MSYIHLHAIAPIVARARTVIAVAATTAILASSLSAQTALGTPFIRSNNLSFYSSELTRRGGAETTTMFGVLYGHRFGRSDAATRMTLVLRGSARPFDDVKAGVLDAAATVGATHDVQSLPGVSVAGSTGAALMAWSDDAARTGRAHLTIPVNAGVSYDLRVRSATISPFAMGTVARYDLRTSLDDVQQTSDKGWDAHYTTGASLRLAEVVLTTSRIVGEHAMPNRSRWTFSAGLSF